MSAKPLSASDRIAYVNARLLDPATGLDETGALLTDVVAVATSDPDQLVKTEPVRSAEPPINSGKRGASPGGGEQTSARPRTRAPLDKP